MDVQLFGTLRNDCSVIDNYRVTVWAEPKLWLALLTFIYKQCLQRCYWKPWGTWIKGTCVKLGRPPPYNSCPSPLHLPGKYKCYRTRQCYCEGRGYSDSKYCSGPSEETEYKACCIPPPTTTPPPIICYPPQPYAPENGRRAEGSDTEPYYVGEVIRFVCNIGYPIVGKDSIKCLSTGHWDGPVPTCNPVCYWKPWGSWINGDCVASGLPSTPQCYRPGNSLCYRTRRCYCVGRGYSSSTYCIGSSKEYEPKPCCLPSPPPP
ncbi:unnamed protein product, partial [Owenia fusiformis]